MKHLTIVVGFFIISSQIFAQKDPNSFLSKIPALPDNACMLKEEQRAKYITEIDKLHQELNDEISLRKSKIEANAKTGKDQMMNKMAKEYGISDADLQKMKDGKKMTKEEKQALIDKTLKEKGNFTLKQLDKINSDSIQSEKNKNMNTYELAKEQKLLIDKIADMDNQFTNQLKELDEVDTLASRELASALNPLFKEMNSINDGEGGTEADSRHREKVLNQIHEREEL